MANQRRRIYDRHVAAAIAEGNATQQEITARWAFKRAMKEAGKDAEYRHSAAELLQAMSDVGFEEVGFVWHEFATAIAVAFAPSSRECKERDSGR